MATSKGDSRESSRDDRVRAETVALLAKNDPMFKAAFEQDPEKFLKIVGLPEDDHEDIMRELALGLGMLTTQGDCRRTCRNTCWQSGIL